MFEFLNPRDGKKYKLPPYDPEKFSDEFAAHPDYVPQVSLADALLADDPEVGMRMLEEPQQAINVLMKRAIVKTLRNHLDATDPAWLALEALINAAEFEVLTKVFTEWRAASGEADAAGED